MRQRQGEKVKKGREGKMGQVNGERGVWEEGAGEQRVQERQGVQGECSGQREGRGRG